MKPVILLTAFLRWNVLGRWEDEVFSSGFHKIYSKIIDDSMRNVMKNLAKRIDRINDYVADKLSYALATMTAFYIISVLVTLPLFYSRPTNLVTWSSYICSVIFQGLALPVLGYTARKSGIKSDRMMQDMSKTTKRIERIIDVMESQQEQIGGIINGLETQQRDISADVDDIVKMEKKEISMMDGDQSLDS